MKKTLSIILSAAMIMSYAVISAAAEENEVSVNYEEKQVSVSPVPGSGDNMEFTCLFRSDLPEIPFVNVEDYLGQVFVLEKESTSLGSGVYKLENGDYSMTIDADKDTVSFDLFEGFLGSNIKNGVMPSYDFIEQGSPYEYVGDAQESHFDLSKYDLDIVEKDGKVYFPYCTLNDMFEEAGTIMRYRNDKLSMTGTMNIMGAKGRFDDNRSKEYAQFSYDGLCFTIDNFCGRPSNALLTNSIKDNGLDKALDSYNSITPRVKELLLSENIEEYCMGLVFLQSYLYDGGHTNIVYSLSDRLAYYGVTDLKSAVKKVFGDEENEDIKEILSIEDGEKSFQEKAPYLTDEKSKAYKSFETIKQWQGAVLSKAGDTYFFNFDSFSYSAVAPFKEALDYAQEHGAKNLIIDMSFNGGGDDVIAAYMLSLMCDNYDFREQYVASKNIVKFKARFDKNLDGVIDEKDDQVKYDFRFAVLGTIGSYSCANIFPCMAQDKGVCIIGEKTAGGSCAVVPRLLANGTGINTSGYMMYLREDGKDADAGAEPDVILPGLDKDYKNFFDIDAINKGIAEFYGDPIQQKIGVYGDIDGDEKVSAKDSLLIQRYVIKSVQFDETQQKAADVNGDGKITAKDALEILRYSIGYRSADSKVNQPLS